MEIQVYLCIFLVVAAIVIPAFISAKKKSHQVSCAANMHRLGLSLSQYIVDNDDRWPSDEAWKNHSFTTTTFEGCPDALSPAEPDAIQGVKGYSYNEAFTTTLKNRRVGISDDAIKYPTFTVALCEESIQHPTTDGPNPNHTSGGEPPSGEEKGWLRHDGGANYLFADGHLKWSQPDEVGYNNAPTTIKGVGLIPTFALYRSQTLKSRSGSVTK